ncbi:uncharacterized protein SPPG_07918 [Spizellomyces punctatus DAOM BR117]|uniref:Uncharacterized protein n=1 Tax=Spizellomyces punctatus (strain DAOM BR117) TaxID=645134 RepID=A0A0L0H756_SPIPD|nr:uncharacterized protein SPPG_07918 [Spizellomyces punctatus DAOM BR117]KNC96706.1 hypothetical protein SPPG_07918 [Spizellomyces punctatus DAOM BR117]|eukprot:XP_016604746.1 hypothetical protein SPPG_07918 [Spizellomyces punctatus DAOM BR117]
MEALGRSDAYHAAWKVGLVIVRSWNSNPNTTGDGWEVPDAYGWGVAETKDNIPAAQIAEQKPSGSESQYRITTDGLLSDCLRGQAVFYRDEKTNKAICVINDIYIHITERWRSITVSRENGFTTFSGGVGAYSLAQDAELLRRATELCKNEGVELILSEDQDVWKRKWSMKFKS